MANAKAYYQFNDRKIGLSSQNGQQINVTDWITGTVYAAGATVRCGGFIYSTVAGGTAGATPPSPNNLSDGTVTWVLKLAGSELCQIDTSPQFELGLVVDIQDKSSTTQYGMGRAQYVEFQSTVNAGDAVLVNRFAKTCVQTPGATPGEGWVSQAGVAFGNAVGTGGAPVYGWVLVTGVHDQANVTAGLTPGLGLSGGAVAGRFNQSVAEYTIQGAVCRAAGVAGTGTVELYNATFNGISNA